MICEYCGTENDNSFRVCKKCGKPLVSATLPKLNLEEKKLIPFSDSIPINGEVKLEDIKARLEDIVAEFGVDCGIGVGDVSTGGFFSTHYSPCVILQHPKYANDYFGYCITVNTNPQMSIAKIYNFGKSKQMGKEACVNNTKVFSGNGARSVAVGAFRGGAVGTAFAVGGLVGSAVGGSARLIKKGIAAITMDGAALEQEKNWYSIINAVLQQAFFGE